MEQYLQSTISPHFTLLNLKNERFVFYFDLIQLNLSPFSLSKIYFGAYGAGERGVQGSGGET